MSPKTKKSSQIVVKSNSKEDLSNKKTSFDLVNQRDFDAQSFETSNCIMKEENISITKTNDSTNLNPKIFYPADVEPTIFPFFFAKNQKIVFNVSGIWSFFPEYGKTDFKGYTEIRDNNNLNVGQLMGRVCGGSPFAISKQHYKFISDSSGQLILYVNGDMVSAKPEGELQIIIEGQCPRLSQRDLDLLSHWNIPLINREDNKFSLSREEYEKVDKEIVNKSTYDTIWKAGYNAYEKTIGECVAEARKETAEKYHKAMRKVIHERDYIGGYAEIGLQEENDEIAEQLGVEIKE